MERCGDTFALPPGVTYHGERNANGAPHGHGVTTYPSGRHLIGGRYIGEWENGKKHGYGTRDYLNGMCYTGEWQNDLRHGRGMCTYSDGATYCGHWVRGKKHGCDTFCASQPHHSGTAQQGGKKHGRSVYEGTRGYHNDSKCARLCSSASWTRSSLSFCDVEDGIWGTSWGTSCNPSFR